MAINVHYPHLHQIPWRGLSHDMKTLYHKESIICTDNNILTFHKVTLE